MHRVVMTRFRGKPFHLLKLIGAFIVLGAALMLLANVYKLLLIASVIDDVNLGADRTIVIDLSGVSLQQQLQPYDFEKQLGLLVVPVAGIMFWGAVFVFGLVLYRTGFFLFPFTPSAKARPSGAVKARARVKRAARRKRKS